MRELHSFFYKNVVFPAQADYSYFSADFRLKIFLSIFLDYSLLHFRFRMYWVYVCINYNSLVVSNFLQKCY